MVKWSSRPNRASGCARVLPTCRKVIAFSRAWLTPEGRKGSLEGVLLASEQTGSKRSRKKGKPRPPSAAGTGGIMSGYVTYYRKVQRLMALPGVGRGAVMQAYFTGQLSATMFQQWQQVVDSAP